MKTSQYIQILMDFQKVNSREKTIKNYRLFLEKFSEDFADWELHAITSENILAFLVQNTDGQKPSTKRLKYTLLKSFFNFVR